MSKFNASGSDSGNSAIEFALLAPVLLVLLLGLVDGWSLISFMINMRAGTGSAVSLYLQGAGDDALVREIAMGNWQERPADADISIKRAYRCGTDVVNSATVCSDLTSPSIEVLINASGTWTAPFTVDFLGTRQLFTHEQTVRVR